MGKPTVEKGTTEVADLFDGVQTRIDRVTLNPLTADPSDAIEGEIWYRGDLHAYRGKTDAGIVTFTVS